MISYSLSTREQLNYLLSSIPSKIYCLLLILGLLFSTGVTGPIDFELVSFALKEKAIVDGRITKVFDEDVVDYESSFEFIFSFEIDGETWVGSSFDYYYDGDQGTEVKVEYVKSNPNISRIQGSENQLYGLGNLTIGIILLLASLIGFIFSLRKLKILQRILQKAGIVKTFKGEAESTMAHVNDNPLYAITYYYEVDSIPYTVIRHSTDASLSAHNEEVLYAIDNPSDSILMLKVPSGLETRIKELDK